MIIWDSNKFECVEKVLGSFAVSVELEYVEEGSFWLTSIYGSIMLLWRKDFLMELQDLYGLAYLKWCIGRDFNVIRRSIEKLAGYRITLNLRRFDELIRELELFDPLLEMLLSLGQIYRMFLFARDWTYFYTHLDGIILLVFGQVSGLKINLEKSSIVGIDTN